jgi:hypothetical protein
MGPRIRVSDYLLLTNTRWDEAPRIRHQVARLLRDAGHRVLFIERAAQAGRESRRPICRREAGIWTMRPTRLLHHQLRVVPALHRVNAAFLVPQLVEACATWSPAGPDAVINFMPDAYFVGDAFPGRRVVTIIHDDFEAQSRLHFRSHITWALEQTCRASERVLAVSVPLCRRLANCCDPALFLPWAVDEYREPLGPVSERNTLLFWGYVDNAIDLAMVRRVSDSLAASRPGWRMLFVGPTQTRGARRRIAAQFATMRNVDLRDPAGLDALPIDRALAAVLPYRRSPAIDSVTLANKSMQLLARGLPLLISAMPSFLKAEFVFRLDGPGGIEPAIETCQTAFGGVQPAIRSFLREHSPAARLRALGVP